MRDGGVHTVTQCVRTRIGSSGEWIKSSRGNHAITAQCLVKDVPPASGGHHSCRKQDSSILQQCEEDDLLLVAIDSQLHDSQHDTVLEGKLS